MESDFLSRVEFADNPERRCPVVLVLDTSGSMDGNPIQQVTEGIRQFEQQIKADVLASLRVEVAIVTFGGTAQVADVRGNGHAPSADSAFATMDQFRAPVLQAYGETPMGEAVRIALQLLRDRKDLYRQAGISYYRPWMMLISDGQPTDHQWQWAAADAVAEEQRNGVSVFPVAVDKADIATLQQFSAKQPPLQLRDIDRFGELFRWLSDSLSAIANSQPGQQVALPNPGGWAVYQP